MGFSHSKWHMGRVSVPGAFPFGLFHKKILIKALIPYSFEVSGEAHSAYPLARFKRRRPRPRATDSEYKLWNSILVRHCGWASCSTESDNRGGSLGRRASSSSSSALLELLHREEALLHFHIPSMEMANMATTVHQASIAFCSLRPLILIIPVNPESKQGLKMAKRTAGYLGKWMDMHGLQRQSETYSWKKWCILPLFYDRQRSLLNVSCAWAWWAWHSPSCCPS